MGENNDHREVESSIGTADENIPVRQRQFSSPPFHITFKIKGT